MPAATLFLDATVWSMIDELLVPTHKKHYLLFTLFTVGEYGSLNQAFPHLDLSGITPVRRRLNALEKKLKVPLVLTEDNWSKLTTEGREVFLRIRPTFAR